ncbi:MAG: hypothetical protein EPN91_02710 [Salinibacterium sp.]|nr:MAG: hypothetical protein EPN91_02710 [Salinibacterium sp.]
MIEWYTAIEIVVALLVGLVCIVYGLVGRGPNDYTLGATLFVELLLVAQFVIALIAPLSGNMPTGSLLEFWLYLGVALIIPPAAVFWGLVERTRWSTVILGAACFAIAVMLYRMTAIWFIQGT